MNDMNMSRLVVDQDHAKSRNKMKWKWNEHLKNVLEHMASFENLKNENEMKMKMKWKWNENEMKMKWKW
jgi:hypothetical protein